jgi:hypothetical protein
MATSGTDVAADTRQGSAAAPCRRLVGLVTWADPVALGLRFFGVTGGLVATLVVTVMLAGCGSDGEGSSEPTAGSQTTPAPTPAASASPEPADPAQVALAVYVAMWDAYDEAARDPQADAEEAGLDRYATGDALAMVTDLVASLREDGLVAEGSIDHSPRVTEMSPEEDPSSARVEDCADTSDQTVVRADGGPYEDEPGGLRLIFADVELHEGVWTVTALGIGRVGSCQR